MVLFFRDACTSVLFPDIRSVTFTRFLALLLHVICYGYRVQYPSHLFTIFGLEGLMIEVECSKDSRRFVGVIKKESLLNCFPNKLHTWFGNKIPNKRLYLGA